MDNMNEEKKNEILKEVKSTLPKEIVDMIRKEVEEIKKNHPDIKRIYPICVKGDEYDTADYYIGYFRQPSFTAWTKYLSLISDNEMPATRQLAKEIFISGDRDLIDDDSLFMFGLMSQLPKIFAMRHGELVNLSKPGK